MTAGHSGRAGTRSALRIAVIGAGVAGLSAALELRRRGAEVAVYDAGTAIGGGASQRAAGMLGAAFEWALEADRPALVDLAQRSAELWPEFAARVEKLGGGSIDYSDNGSVVLARNADEAAWLSRLTTACQSRGLAAERLDPNALRALEPSVSREVVAALLLPGDGHVDAALLLQRLASAASRAGVGLRLGRAVERIGFTAGQGETVFTLPDGLQADRVVLATGMARPAPRFHGHGQDWEGVSALIVPVKGHMLALAPSARAPSRVLRTRDGYVAPKSRWTLVGSSAERGRSDTVVDRTEISRLRSLAVELAPDLAAAEEITAWAGVRPGTPDDAPMIGETNSPGVYASLGYYRNGVLLAPAAAELLADQIIDGKVSKAAAAFDPARFDNRLRA